MQRGKPFETASVLVGSSRVMMSVVEVAKRRRNRQNAMPSQCLSSGWFWVFACFIVGLGLGVVWLESMVVLSVTCLPLPVASMRRMHWLLFPLETYEQAACTCTAGLFLALFLFLQNASRAYVLYACACRAVPTQRTTHARGSTCDDGTKTSLGTHFHRALSSSRHE